MKRTLRIRSRHPSHQGLRRAVMGDRLAVLRLGSTTPTPGIPIQLNSPEAVIISSDKLKMKEAFKAKGVHTANWYKIVNTNNGFGFVDQQNGTTVSINDLPYPVILKGRFGSRNRGNSYFTTPEELKNKLNGCTISNYIVERYYTYLKEYRVHVSATGGYIYTNRKMLKKGTPENESWHRHNDNCVWYLEDNPEFAKPRNWQEIIRHCQLAREAVGLDICAIDLRVQGADVENPLFIIIETNSAPSFGEGTLQKYKEHLPELIKFKINN